MPGVTGINIRTNIDFDDDHDIITGGDNLLFSKKNANYAKIISYKFGI